jgi:uncharacterized protein (UPF0210 family)
MARSGTALMAASLPTSYGALAGATNPGDALPPIRTITAGVTLAGDDPTAGIRRSAAFLEEARDRFEAAGLTVQTTRIVTQPFGEYAGELRSPARQDLMEAMTETARAHSLAIGPAHLQTGNADDSIETAVTAATLGISSTLRLAEADGGLQTRSVEAAARVIRQIAQRDPAANFNFAAAANVPPGVPFFPAGYHDGGPDSFALGLEAAGLFLRVCRQEQSLDTAGPALARAYAEALRPIEQLALSLEAATGWRYTGIDTTPAQWGTNSIGAAVEALTGHAFGRPGTLTACRVLTGVVQQAPVRLTGFRGLFLPPMEDATLAARAHDHYGLDTLLACSAVCGTGLDTVALPGDTSVDELARILRDVASLAFKLDKPLTARLFPVPGRGTGESTGPVGDLFPMKILRIH